VELFGKANPPIWLLLLGSKDVEDHRLNIMKGINKFCHATNMQFDEYSFFLKKMVKALVEMSPNPLEGLLTFESTAKSLNILAYRPNLAAKIEKERTRAQVDKDTKKTGSLGEALQLETE
jgi:hypothetical protein